MDRNYLKYWKIAKYWAKHVHRLSEEDLETLLFIYKEPPFTKSTFGLYDNMNILKSAKLPRFLKKGLIYQYRKRTPRNGALYEISTVGSRICSDVYSILEGKKRVPILEKETLSNKIYNTTVKNITDDTGKLKV
jgi:hypothetical protein